MQLIIESNDQKISEAIVEFIRRGQRIRTLILFVEKLNSSYLCRKYIILL